MTKLTSKPSNLTLTRRTNLPAISKKASGSGALTDKERAAKLITRTANLGMNTSMAQQGAFFSPQLSTDFLELPQTLRERREIYRHYYNTDPIVGQAIDLHTELPLSKLKLGTPKPTKAPKGFESPHEYASYILKFFTDMSDRLKLLQKLLTMTHHYWLEGGVFVFAEDSTVEVPMEIGHSYQQLKVSVLHPDGSTKEEPEDSWVPKPNVEDLELAYYSKNYKGWKKLIVIPVDQVVVEQYSFVDEMKVELIPSEKDRALVEDAKSGDPRAAQLVAKMPEEIRQYLETGKNIPLGTDPNEGSFVYYLTCRRDVNADVGQSILDRCHHPETLVLVNRNHTIQQIKIKDLDPDTDLILSDKNEWREFEIGSRNVSEDLVEIQVYKVWPPVVSTADHRYPVLRDGVLVELPAKDIQPGDFLKVPSIPVSGKITEIDLASYVSDLTIPYSSRKSKKCVDAKLSVCDRTQDQMWVSVARGETNPKITNKIDGLNSLLTWANTLKEPYLAKSEEMCRTFSMCSQELKERRVSLADYGYQVEVLKDKTMVWPPNHLNIRVPSDTNSIMGPISTKIPLNGDTGYLMGYFLGDGYVTRTPLGHSFNIVYHNETEKSKASGNKVRDILEKVGGSLHEHCSTKNMVLLSSSNVVFSQWVAENFGKVCVNKKLPSWVFDSTQEFLFGLLRGFLDSDGDITHKTDGSISLRLSNTNPILSDQLMLVCLSLGIPASKTRPQPSRSNLLCPNETNTNLYSIHFTQTQAVNRVLDSGWLAKKPTGASLPKSNSGIRHKEFQGDLYYRVGRVSIIPGYSGPVFSLNVHKDHSFYANSLATKNCLRTLTFREKLRQAQTQIASRAMTPKRIVWAEDISAQDVEDLREQIDYALVDPDYTIVTNFEVRWEEIGASGRLLDLSSEWDNTDKLLYAGLGVTESLLSGEALYSGDRLKLEVINTRYLLLRDTLQEYVEQYLFKPVSRRKGFVEIDKWGNEHVIYPRLTFTRLPLRDSQDTADALFNLYNKGSLDISLILELFNIDPEDTRAKIEKDMFTVNDPLFNEVLRGAYGEAARTLPDETNLKDVLIQNMGLTKKAPPPEAPEGRF